MDGDEGDEGSGVNQERLLSGGTQTSVTVLDGIVYRSAKPQSPTVLTLLRHLEASGFEAAPKVHGEGFDVAGRETLGFIAGESPQPRSWTDDALARVGGLLRELHAATASYRSPEEAVWFDRFTRRLPGDRPVIGHGDLGPWNILARDGLPVAFIDWDQAGPVDAIWELAEVAWLNVQLHDDDVAEIAGLGDARARARQLRIFVDGYGLDRALRGSFVDRMAEFAIHSACEEAILGSVTPTSHAAIDDTGFPVMWAIAWRSRAASWILRNREILRRALENGH